MALRDRPVDEIEITPETLLAGVRAWEQWNYGEEEPEGMVAAVFFAMSNAKTPQRRRSTDIVMAGPARS